MSSATLSRACPILLGMMFAVVLSGCGSRGSSYEGTWSGKSETGLHVREIVIDKNEFPCNGVVAIQFGSGQVFNLNVAWQEKDGQLAGMMGDGDKKDSIATAKLSGGTLSGQVTSPIAIGGKKELSFSGFQRQPKKEK